LLLISHNRLAAVREQQAQGLGGDEPQLGAQLHGRHQGGLLRRPGPPHGTGATLDPGVPAVPGQRAADAVRHHAEGGHLPAEEAAAVLRSVHGVHEGGGPEPSAHRLRIAGAPGAVGYMYHIYIRCIRKLGNEKGNRIRTTNNTKKPNRNHNCNNDAQGKRNCNREILQLITICRTIDLTGSLH